MKKITLLISLTIICSAFIITCKPEKKHQNPVLQYPLPHEDTLDLTHDPVSQSQAAKNLDYEAECLLLQQPGGTIVDLNSYAGKIDTFLIDTLYNRASKLAAGITSHYITVLQINYGIDSNNFFVLFFRPLCLTCTSDVSYTGTYSVTTRSQSTANSYCRVSSSGAVLANCKFTPFEEDTARYTQQIRIRHHLTDTYYGTFNATAWTDTMGDVRYVYFPFQEILGEVRDNAGTMQGYNYLTLVNTCIIRPVVVSGAIDSLVKEDVFFGLANLPTMPELSCTTTYRLTSGIFTNMYADLAHMCPPDQSSLTYKLIYP